MQSARSTGHPDGFAFESPGDFHDISDLFQLYNEVVLNACHWRVVWSFVMVGPTEYVLQDRTNNEKRRSERLKLTVPVLVTTATVDGRDVQEIAKTVIVNAHGGLFRSTMEFLVAQPLVLTNLNTNMKESARVVHAEPLQAGGFGVAFEFDNAAPEFWQLENAPDDWNLLGLSRFESEVRN